MTPDEILRYSRHTILPEFGSEGQERLRAGKVLVVGAGGLGSPAALYLVAAGVGTIGLVDFDTVDVTNLQRQVLYGSSDVGRPKVEAARARLADLNPYTDVRVHQESFGPGNARRLVSAYDVVLDGTDNFGTRYLVNDACVMAGRPNVYGSVFRFEGQAAVFAAPGGPCYRCLHPEPPPAGLIPNCAEAGVLGVLPGVIGLIQATEAIKLLTGIGEPLIGRLLLYDALGMRIRQIALPRDPACPVCGDAPTIRELVEYDLTCEPAMAGDNRLVETVLAGPTLDTSPAEAEGTDMKVEQLHDWRMGNKTHLLIDVREPGEHAVSRIEGARLVPLLTLQSQVASLPKDQPIVVYCQSGGRSAIAVAMLRVQGFDARNLSGGIKAWKARIDAG